MSTTNAASPPAPLKIPFNHGRYPDQFQFQNPATFLLNGDDMRGWTENERAPFITESLNRERWHFFRMAAGFLHSAGVRGDYHEYGCFSATSFRMMLSETFKLGFDAMNFFAFDSFEGLPEISSEISDQLNWTPGSMAMSVTDFRQTIEAHGVYADRVEAIAGFFDRSLTPELQRRFLSQEQPLAMATIDCDLYESAVPVFKFIEPLLQEGTLLYIDDYFAGYRGSPRHGVARAFHDFEQSSRFKFQDFLNVGWWGKSFIAYRDAV